MDESIISTSLTLFEQLTLKGKLNLLAKLAQRIGTEIPAAPHTPKEDLIDELFGSWQDIDDEAVAAIYQTRTSSNTELTLD